MTATRDDGLDWRSEHDRHADDAPAAADLERAQEPGRGREADTPVDIPASGWKDIAYRAFQGIAANRLMAMSGGVAFFALMSLFPGIATVVSLYGLIANANTIADHVDLLSGFLPTGALQLIRDQVLLVVEKGNNALSVAFLVGLVVGLWSANSGVSALFDALNVVYGEKEKRSLMMFYATTLAVTLGCSAFVAMALAGVVILPAALVLIGVHSSTEALLQVLRWPVLMAMIVVLLSIVYRIGPSRRDAKWRWVSPGSILAAILWVGASMVFSSYVTAFDSYNRIYGSLGAVVGFMTWTWLSIFIVLLGAQVNAEMEHQTARDTTEGDPLPLGVRGATMADHIGKSIDEP